MTPSNSRIIAFAVGALVLGALGIAMMRVAASDTRPRIATTVQGADSPDGGSRVTLDDGRTVDFTSFGVTISLQQLLVNGEAAGIDATPEVSVAGGESLDFEMRLAITKTLLDGCEADGCPTRLHLLLMRDGVAARQCHPDILRQDQALLSEWQGTLAIPRTPGRYMLAILLSPGETCTLPSDLTERESIMRVEVRDATPAP